MANNIPFIAVAFIAIIGLATMLMRKNIIKIIMGLGLVEGAVNLFLVALGYRQDGIAPIFTNAPSTHMVLPTVQAMVLTSIVIGVATLALLLSFAIYIYQKYGTLNSESINRLRG
ncbi:cation:proton antiporter subunit C [candidate division FCPU426 bacterium]|nr:cation:proton antiporter subunit C [candidate division FCPU426 bacterium]